MSEYVHHTPAETLDTRQTVSQEPYSVSDSYGIDEKSERKIAKKLERLMKRRARLPLKFGAAAIALTSLSFTYWHDVQENRELSIESQPEIHTISEQAGEVLNTTSTFYLAGFDTGNGDVFGDKVGVAIQEIVPSATESINYGDAPLDPEEIAKKIIGYTEERQLDSIALAGNSLGGIIAAEVAEYIILNSDIQVEAIILNATPDGRNGLLPETQGNLTSMMDWLRAIPGSKYSTFARYIATMSQESGSFMQSGNPEDFIETSQRVWGQVQERRRPGMWLLVDQALAITNANLEESIRSIGEQRGDKRMPVIISMRTQNPKDDVVVDVAASSRNICDYAEEARLDCEIVLVKGATHTSYEFNVEEFLASLSDKAPVIRQEIEHETTAYDMSRYGYYATESYTIDEDSH